MLRTGSGLFPTFCARANEIPASVRACKTRAVLSEEQAVQIFMIRIANSQSLAESIHPEQVAIWFGISEKTVRDIWKGRTWRRETMHLDANCMRSACKLRLPGRPKGSQTKAKGVHGTGPTNASIDAAHSSAAYPAVPLEYASAVAISKASCNKSPASVSIKMPDGTSIGQFTSHAYLSSSLGRSTQQAWECSPVAPSWFTGAVDPLPESSRPEDPFHDDWPQLKIQLPT